MGQTVLEDQITEIFIVRDQNPPLNQRYTQNLRIAESRRMILGYGGRIVPLLLQISNEAYIDILIQQKVQRRRLDCRRSGSRPALHYPLRVLQARLHIFRLESRIGAVQGCHIQILRQPF